MGIKFMLSRYDMIWIPQDLEGWKSLQQASILCMFCPDFHVYGLCYFVGF